MGKDYTDKIMGFFAEICNIPRPSGHEEKMGAYLKEFAGKRSLGYKTDEIGNVLVCKPATPGMEGHDTIILQAHQDMVCEKDAELEHNFLTQPIETYVEDGWLKARGTTLGADDGMGMAMALAILDSSDIPHGPLECLFTVSEETGLYGAKALKKGMITGSKLINLDSEDEGEIFIGCAGGVSTETTFDYSYELVPEGYFFMEISIDKLHGGHSGDDINKGFANANKLMARFLYQSVKRYDLRLCTINGGNLHNAIPRDAKALVALPSKDKESIRVDFNLFAAAMQEEFHVTERNMEFVMNSAPAVEHCMEKSVADKLVTALTGAVNGVYAMSMDIEGLVETSSNLARVRTEERQVKVALSQRSSSKSGMEAVKNSIQATFELAGAKVKHGEGYPGWTPNPKSELLEVAVRTYRELFNKEPKVKAIHAGLECGLFLEAYPHLDMISVGPTLRSVHSPSERLELKTVGMVYDHLLAILKQ